jgi:hybrid cluster-associated redox disulfide protein
MEEQVQEQRVITADMPIGEVVGRYPSTIPVFLRHGLGCIGCAVAQFESIRQGAKAHGIELGALVEDLNQSVSQSQD